MGDDDDDDGDDGDDCCCSDNGVFGEIWPGSSASIIESKM